MIFRLRSPSGGVSSWFDMTFSGETGTCENTINKTHETFINSTATDEWCPEEGYYDIQLGVYSEWGAECGEYNWNYSGFHNNTYYLDYDAREEWCECLMGSGSNWDIGFSSGTTGDCCGDDANEFKRVCAYSILDICAFSTDDDACCPGLGHCVFEDDCYPDGYEISAGPGSIVCDSGVWKDGNPPIGVSVGYINGFYNGPYDYYTVTVDDGQDMQTGISSVQLYMQTASLNDGSCGTFGSWTSYGTQSVGTTSVPVQVTTGTCYRFNYSSTNGEGLTAYATSTNKLKVDMTDPITTDNYIAGGTHGGTVDVQLLCTDSQGSGCNETFYCTYDEQNESECDVFSKTDGTVSVNCTGEECYMRVRYYSKDKAGNSEEFRLSGVIHINNDLPWCSFTAPDPQGGQYTNDSYITLQWDGDDPGGSGVKSFEILNRTDESVWGSLTGNVTYKTFARDFADNHKHDFRCIITNNDNETGESGILTLFVDSTPPATTLTSVPAWTTGNVTVEWEGNDFGGSGIKGFTIQKNTGSSWSLWKEYDTGGSDEYEFQEGEDTVKFRAHADDKALNTGEWSAEATSRLDTDPPTCALNTLDEYQTHNNFSVRWSGSDGWEGEGSSTGMGGKIYYMVQFSTDQSEWNTLTGTERTEDTARLMQGSDGNEYYFRCNAEDSAGNVGDWSPIRSTTIDSSPPDITSLKYNTSVAKDEHSNITATVSDTAGIGSVTLTIDNEEITPYMIDDDDENEWNLAWNFMSIETGTMTAKITVTDVNGNSFENTFNFTIKACIDGDSRECDPEDPETGTAYAEGVCRHTGTRTCSSGMWSECTGGTLPSKEDCNELDDDCDGEVDESDSGGLLVKSCGTDAGVCSAGLMTCVDGNWSSCAGQEGPNPEGEICGNNLDDDCNGVADEDCACEEGDTQPCGESNVGECNFGVQTCENGKWSTVCDGSVDPVDEVCNNLKDDDCDGKIDCDDSDCYLYSSCAGTSPGTGGDVTEPFPIGNILMLVGVIVMGVLLFLWYWFRKAGQELTWEAVRQKWGG